MKQYTITEAKGLLRSYGFTPYFRYLCDNNYKMCIEIWRSSDNQSIYLHILNDDTCFFAKPFASHNSVLRYLREIRNVIANGGKEGS